MSSSKLVLLLVALFCGAQLASAYPRFFITRPRQCGLHPATRFGPHRAPAREFTVTPLAGGAAIRAPGPLRPGQRYRVRVTWNSRQINHALFTTSLGTLGTRNFAPSTCLRSDATRSAAPGTYTNTLILAASNRGRVTLKLTHSAPGLPYYFWNVTYNVQPASGRKLV